MTRSPHDGDGDDGDERSDAEEQVASRDVWPTVLPGPPSWPAVFGRHAPLEVELGFGRPQFILERAREVPERDVVGIEWKGRWPRLVWEQQARGKAPLNLRALHGNAWLLFGSLFAPATVSSLFLSFPDPWWKAKHQKRRIVSDAFAAVLVSRLAPGGMLLVQSDVASLLEEYLARLEAQPGVDNPFGRGRLCTRKPVAASSHREQRCRELGIPIFRGLVVKR